MVVGASVRLATAIAIGVSVAVSISVSVSISIFVSICISVCVSVSVPATVSDPVYDDDAVLLTAVLARAFPPSPALHDLSAGLGCAGQGGRLRAVTRGGEATLISGIRARFAA
ncbi:hypothetical protein BC938DRAFT_483667 [Jimgerdemannia flammicorona]|uniref:Uncharacterized protein n=1 Tax=Jimgerdemannia flammicorona TaxID=994334 RepID=A0A433QBI7_9FUNG|nr:hypothetical protein BC938DRAFT_483667 [Jimgerdemannia flammicorona]